MDTPRYLGLAAVMVASLLLTIGAVGNLVRGDGDGGAAGGSEVRLPVTFSGGHETDRRDGGRPVVLVAAGLGVTPEKFREAFSGVRPARGGPPEPAQVRRNKEALMRVLGPLAVTNERLDEVSNWYRYRPESGELWRNTPAKAYAVVENGAVVKIVVTEGGAGYSTPPEVTVKGMPGVKAKAVVAFGKDLKTNGSVKEVVLEGAGTQRVK